MYQVLFILGWSGLYEIISNDDLAIRGEGYLPQ
jgi:hypothetical protein